MAVTHDASVIHEGPWPCKNCQRFQRINAELRGQVERLQREAAMAVTALLEEPQR